MYSAQVLDHFQNPRNPGPLDGADATVKRTNPACGDTLQLMAKLSSGPVEPSGRIEHIRFLARGCVASIACASALTELAAGKTLAEARTLSRDQLVGALGGLPPASMHASHLALDALQALLDQLQSKT